MMIRILIIAVVLISTVQANTLQRTLTTFPTVNNLFTAGQTFTTSPQLGVVIAGGTLPQGFLKFPTALGTLTDIYSDVDGFLKTTASIQNTGTQRDINSQLTSNWFFL